jgi:hypothetical protein
MPKSRIEHMETQRPDADAQNFSVPMSTVLTKAKLPNDPHLRLPSSKAELTRKKSSRQQRSRQKIGR